MKTRVYKKSTDARWYRVTNDLRITLPIEFGARYFSFNYCHILNHFTPSSGGTKITTSSVILVPRATVVKLIVLFFFPPL